MNPIQVAKTQMPIADPKVTADKMRPVEIISPAVKSTTEKIGTLNNSNTQNTQMVGVIFEKSPESLSQIQTASAYDKTGNIYNKEKINELKASVDNKLQTLRETVRAMVEKQGYTYQEVLSSLDVNSQTDQTNKEQISINIDNETKLKAQAEISEDGFWGVKQTSERILEFAKTISGDDKSKFDLLKSSIKEGFESAKEAFGGELPEISQNTYDAVMKGLETWSKGTIVNS